MRQYNAGVSIALDILGPLPLSNKGNKYILVVSDYFTKWPEAYSLPNQEATIVAEVLVKEFISCFGEPRASDCMKRYFDIDTTESKLEARNAVWLYSPQQKKGLSPKLQKRGQSHYVIIKRINDLNCRIQLGP